ncbi:hypothetical protein [Pedobacter miscanthi]|uniref:hypothetical protein n=1 Tax=Pedobacter miscanthi TaxID=2259170 RepID=UPI002931ED09|nr:hypothetical protein [Pedobacter miscanthi]
MKFSKIKSLVFTALVAVVLVVGGSAFKPVTGGNYGQQSNGTWVPIDNLTPVGPLDDPQEGEYKCETTGDLCRAHFDYDNPAQNADDYTENSEVAGTFILGEDNAK